MPTSKQELVLRKITENHRISISRAMREAGYSNHTASKPSNLTDSKGWKDMLDQAFSEEELLGKLNDLLGAVTLKVFEFPNFYIQRDIEKIINSIENFRLVSVQRNKISIKATVAIPDNATRLKALELAYKLKGKLNFKQDAKNTSNEELREVIFRIRKILPMARQ